MLNHLKKTEFGMQIYRFSRHPVVGFPVRMLSRGARFVAVQTSHLVPANRRHNARVRADLARFEGDKT